MLSVVHDSFGEPSLVLRAVERPKPEPGPGEARLRLILSPIHNHDLMIVQGTYGFLPPLPAAGGTEAVGVVDAVGPGVDAGLVGRRFTALGMSGGWSEFFVAPAAGLTPLPDAIDDGAAAQLIAMPFSAFALLDSLQVSAGDWIVQNAANGTVGRILAMVAKARGVRTVNLVRRNAGVAELAPYDIENVISTEAPDWKAQVRALTGEAGAKAGIDSIGGVASGDLADVLGDGAKLVIFGNLSGEPTIVPASATIFRGLRIEGYWVSKYGGTAADRARIMEELIRLVASGELRLPVGGTFSLKDAAAAATAAVTPGRPGKVMFRP